MDKGKIAAKEDELSKTVKTLTDTLRNKPSATKEEMCDIARQLVTVASQAISCQTELLLNPTEQSQQETQDSAEDESEQI